MGGVEKSNIANHRIRNAENNFEKNQKCHILKSSSVYNESINKIYEDSDEKQEDYQIKVQKRIRKRRRKNKQKKKEERVYKGCLERNGRSKSEILRYMERQRRKRAAAAK